MVCDVGRHRVRYALGRSIRYDIRGDESRDGGALGESAEHHVGVGAISCRRLDMGARVPNTGQGSGEFGGGRVVDWIDRHRPCADPRAQRIHECLSCRTNTGLFSGAAREYHLDVGAGLCRRGRNGCDQLSPTCRCHAANQNSDVAAPHRAMLTYRGDGGHSKNQRPVNDP